MAFVGNLGQAAANSALVANYKIASRYQASASFNALTMMTILSTDFTEDFTVRLGIYSDDGGEPKVLLGATGTIRGLGIEDGVYHGTLGSAVAIVAGEYYWLALMTDGDINMRATSTGTGDSREVDDDYVDGFSYEFGTGSSDTVALCIGAGTRTQGGFCRGSLLYGGAVMQAPPSAGSGGGSVWAVVRSETGDVVVYQDLGGPKTPEVDWFTYSVTDQTFRWQTFEEFMVRGFSVEYAPDRIQGLVWEPPVSLWSSGYIVAQAPGTLGGAQYEVAAPQLVRMHRALLCTWYETWWRCDLPPSPAARSSMCRSCNAPAAQSGTVNR